MQRMCFLVSSAQAPSVSREETASTSGKKPVSEQLPFLILDDVLKSFPKFNTTWRRLLITFNSPSEKEDPGNNMKGIYYSIDKLHGL